MINISYRESHEACRKISLASSKLFYFGCLVLPERKREAVFALYSFCHFVDDGMNHAKSAGEKNAHIKNCQNILDRVYSHQRNSFSLPFEISFEQTISRYEIPMKLADDYITGMILNSHFKQPENKHALLEYCYHLTGCVGIMMAHILGEGEKLDQKAMALGNAIQLTKLARDLKQNSEFGKICLPISWLEETNLKETDIINLSKTENADQDILGKMRLLQLRIVSIAEENFKLGLEGLPNFSNDGSRFSVSFLVSSYMGILKKIKRNASPSPLDSQGLSFLEKLLLIPKAYVSEFK